MTRRRYPPFASARGTRATVKLALGLGLALVSCTSSRATGGGERVTAVRVEPRAFLGSVPCQLGEQVGLKRYVATLSDVSSPDVSFTLPSSPPTACDRGVNFTFVAPGHLYSAEIAGYDRTDLVPLTAGSSVMVAKDDETDFVTPSWRARCGTARPDSVDDPDAGTDGLDDSAGADYAVRVITNRIIPFTSCEVLNETG